MKQIIEDEFYKTGNLDRSMNKGKNMEKVKKANIEIINCGVYRPGMSMKERMTTSAVDQGDFRPHDFIDRRRQK